jgi:hypothetical protein
MQALEALVRGITRLSVANVRTLRGRRSRIYMKRVSLLQLLMLFFVVFPFLYSFYSLERGGGSSSPASSLVPSLRSCRGPGVLDVKVHRFCHLWQVKRVALISFSLSHPHLFPQVSAAPFLGGSLITSSITGVLGRRCWRSHPSFCCPTRPCSPHSVKSYP